MTNKTTTSTNASPDKAVILVLNQVLGQALIAINQYFLHARIAKNWGISGLNQSFYKQSIAEMKYADALIERILLLGGLPNLQDLGKLLLGETVEEMLTCDLKLEARKHDTLKNAIAICENRRDYVSRELLLTLKDDNEEYSDWLSTQQELIQCVGLPNYVQLKAS